jgi:hypothetical protein
MLEGLPHRPDGDLQWPKVLAQAQVHAAAERARVPASLIRCLCDLFSIACLRMSPRTSDIAAGA